MQQKLLKRPIWHLFILGSGQGRRERAIFELLDFIYLVENVLLHFFPAYLLIQPLSQSPLFPFRLFIVF